MSSLYSLEQNFHSLVTQVPFGKVFPKFHVTILTIIPVVGAYLYFREYRNPPINPNKIDPSILHDARHTIKISDKIKWSVVEKKQEEVISFLPERPPENKVEVTADTITKVQNHFELNKMILNSYELAFENNFVDAKNSLEEFKKGLDCPPEMMKEIACVIEQAKNFIDQLEIIAGWGSLGPFDDEHIKDISSPACRSWKKAMQEAFKIKVNPRFFFHLVEIGLSRVWFEPASKELYEPMFQEVEVNVDQQLEKTW